MDSARLLCPWDSPAQNTGAGSSSLLQGIFPTQGLNPGLLHCKWILYCLSHQGSLKKAGRQRIDNFETVVHVMNGTLLSHEKEGNSVICNNTALVLKNLPASAGDVKDVGSIPGLGRSPGRGQGSPLHYSCLENPMNRGAW